MPVFVRFGRFSASWLLVPLTLIPHRPSPQLFTLPGVPPTRLFMITGMFSSCCPVVTTIPCATEPFHMCFV